MVKIPFNSAKLPLTNKPRPMFLINSFIEFSLYFYQKNSSNAKYIYSWYLILGEYYNSIIFCQILLAEFEEFINPNIF